MAKYLAGILLLFVGFSTQAQSWELGVFGGGAGYMGDLNPNNVLKVSGVAVGGFVKRNINGYFSVRAGYTYGLIRAADSTSGLQQFRDRNLSFTTKLSEASLTGEFNFMKYIPSVSHDIYTPFIFAGIAYTAYNPQAKYNGVNYDLRPLTTEGQATPYNNSAFAVPFGAGIKYNIAGRLTLIADLGYRRAYTDYLDDVAGDYADKSKLPGALSVALSDRSGEKTGTYIGTAGTQRGDQRSKDTYLFIGLSISYTFITPKCYF